MTSVEELKSLINRLNDGMNPEDIIREAKEVLGNVDPEELTAAEQKMIESGLPHNDLRNLCTLHMEIIKEQLNNMRNKLDPDHVVYTMVAEHDTILSLVNQLDSFNQQVQELDRYDPNNEVFRNLKTISAILMKAQLHHMRENNMLFPEMAKKKESPAYKMIRMEHDEIIASKKEIQNLVEQVESMEFKKFKNRLNAAANYLVVTLREHVFKENNVLYPSALETIDEEKSWEMMKEQCDSIGYCCFTPEKNEEPLSMQEMIAIYEKVAEPGEPHKMLAGMEGTWMTQTKEWVKPNEPPLESTGMCDQKMILGGRYLQQEYSFNIMDKNFSGINLIGYNNHTKKYTSTWVDTMSTGIFYFEGEPSPDYRSIEQTCRYDDPARGPSRWRSVTKIIDTNTVEYEMFLTVKSGNENKVSEMIMRRMPVLRIKRLFNAIPEMVWNAWSDPEKIMLWWGPNQFTVPIVKMDFHEGGAYINCMRSPEGRDFWSTGVYREIIPFKKIVSTDCFSDEAGNIVPASYYGMSDNFPMQMTMIINFEKIDNKTLLNLQHIGIPNEEYENCRIGWEQSFNKLDEVLSKE